MGVICSCLPTLKAWVVRLFPRFFITGKGSASDHAGLRVGSGTLSAKQHAERSRQDTLGLKYSAQAEIYDGTWHSELAECSSVQLGDADPNGIQGIHVMISVKQESRKGTVDRFGYNDPESTKNLVRDAS